MLIDTDANSIECILHYSECALLIELSVTQLRWRN